MSSDQVLVDRPYTKQRPDDAVIYRNPYRIKRMAKLVAMIDKVVARKGACKIVDLGGRYDFWNVTEQQKVAGLFTKFFIAIR